MDLWFFGATVIIDDFNQDGRMDIALATSSSNASAIRIFWGNGDGTFKKPFHLANGRVPLALTQKDMNDDGFMDMLCTSGKDDNMYLFIPTSGFHTP